MKNYHNGSGTMNLKFYNCLEDNQDFKFDFGQVCDCEFEGEFYLTPYEAPSWDSPGCSATAEIQGWWFVSADVYDEKIGACREVTDDEFEIIKKKMSDIRFEPEYDEEEIVQEAYEEQKSIIEDDMISNYESRMDY